MAIMPLKISAWVETGSMASARSAAASASSKRLASRNASLAASWTNRLSGKRLAFGAMLSATERACSLLTPRRGAHPFAHH
jgi:hypothetical protein